MAKFKKSKWPFILILVVAASALFFFYRIYRIDVEELQDFAASYEKYGKALSDFSVGETGDSESKAVGALDELITRAAKLRISSLIKNDAGLMGAAREIADFSRIELDKLRNYKKAIQKRDPGMSGLAEEYVDATGDRISAFARFRELGKFKD